MANGINPSQTALDTARKYAGTSNFANPPNPEGNFASYGTNPAKNLLLSRDKPSSEPIKDVPAQVNFNGGVDLRTRLKLPPSFSSSFAAKYLPGGYILFPYTPSVQVEHIASYKTVNTVHSNYTQYFYTNSSVSDITVTADVTVQTEKEAAIYLSMVHLLRGLTKMKFGNDPNAGSPPPICRFFSFGTYMFNNVPVSITSFRLDLKNDVDYFTTGRSIGDFGTSAVPVYSTFNIMLKPIYSRDEMRKGTVSGWLTDQIKQGYL